MAVVVSGAAAPCSAVYMPKVALRAQASAPGWLAGWLSVRWRACVAAQELLIRMRDYRQPAAPVACRLSVYVNSQVVSKPCRRPPAPRAHPLAYPAASRCSLLSMMQAGAA